VGTEGAFGDGDDLVAAIVDSLDEAAFVLDEAETVIHLNQAAAEILAVERDQIVGQPFSDDLYHRYNSCARVRLALKESGSFPAGRRQIELFLNVKGCDRPYILKSACLRRSDGSSCGTLVVLREASELLRKTESKGDTVLAVAQELNTPLTSVSLAVGLLQRTGERQNELIREIVEDVDRLNHASADFLNIVRARNRPIGFRQTRFDLWTIIDVVSRKCGKWIECRQIHFAVHAERNIEVLGDPLKLVWVIATLVGNAVRHTPEMGKVALTAEKGDEQVRICVWDSGPGIPLQTLEMVFGTMRQANTDIQSLGIGVGLNIAKEIVEAHGGRLFAEKLEGGGRVTLTVPVSEDV
jgi:signal transduction histidine kinase